MAKTVSLSVHRNKIEKRARRERERDMVSAAKRMARDNDVITYAIVGITKDGRALSAWDTGAAIPMWALPGAVYRVLDHSIDGSVDEDFYGPLRDV